MKNKSLKIVIFLISIYCIFNIIVTQVAINRQTQKLIEIKNKCEQQMSDNEEYRNTIVKESDDEYIKKIARDKLGFVSPDDRVFIDISSK